MYSILFSADTERDLRRIPRYYRNWILDSIEAQLAYEPLAPARNRKILVNLVPPWEPFSVIWELWIGEYRVFYDVDKTRGEVYVRAVRKKPRGKTTKEVL